MTRALPFFVALAHLALGAWPAAAQSPPPPASPAQRHQVSALGRLEPEHGVLHIAAPSTPAAVSGSVVLDLAVEVGDDVAAGALLATTDSTGLLAAALREVDAELRLAQRSGEAATSRAEEACVLAELAAREAERRARLVEQEVLSVEESDRAASDATAQAAACRSAESEKLVAESAVEVARARRSRVAAELERSRIKAPVAGRVLAIHARRGELIGSQGLLELARVDRMYAIAEVFESDIRSVRPGQRARVTSAALTAPLTGRVERVRPLVHKQDVVGTDPAALKDARIVEVEILLDDAAPAASLTYLQVDIVIDTGP